VPAMERSIQFLRYDAAIPHRRLLPYSVPLVALPVFFARDPSPDAGTRRQLTRWVWRGFVSGIHERKAPLRHAVDAARGEAAVEQRSRAMLATVPKRPTADWQATAGFRTDVATHRIGLLGLASLAPLHLDTGLAVDIAATLGSDDGLGRVISSGDADGRHTIANWLLHPRIPNLRGALRACVPDDRSADPRLLSHAVDPDAGSALANNDAVTFLSRRRAAIERVVADRISVFAEWDAVERVNLRRLTG
jgi:hypothetical protein